MPVEPLPFPDTIEQRLARIEAKLDKFMAWFGASIDADEEADE